MKQLRSWLALAVAFAAVLSQAGRAQQPRPAYPRTIDLKSTDGTLLKATFFPAAKPGPGVLLFHQSNRTRSSWIDLARQLAAAGIHTLTIDGRAHGESGGKREDAREKTPADMETCLQFLISQPGVERDVIGLAGAGSYGVINALETARLEPAAIKSLVMLSGDSFPPGIEFLHEASQLPELFVIADTDEYPPTVEATFWLYARASTPMKKLIHYSASQEAPWVWYETSDPAKVPETGSHGTDLFRTHPDLPGMIVQWFVATLIKTPGRAPVDPLAAGAVLNQLASPGGAAAVTQQLMEARKRDARAQLFPEVSLDVIGSGFLAQADEDKKTGRLGDADEAMKTAIEIFLLNVVAYPDSADAHSNVANAYLQIGEKILAREYAQKALAMIDSHAAPVSSWSDTEQRRAEVRNYVEDLLKKLDAFAPRSAIAVRPPSSPFRDCADCPEMLVIPAGKFVMGSSAAEKAWAASKAGSADGVADEAPQHEVTVPSFGLGKYDVTRGEFAAFVRETGHSDGDGCGIDGFEWKKQLDKTWQNPGYSQTDRDPVVCVSWQDAKAYIAWLNAKVRQNSPASSNLGPYRLPSESEWEYATRAGTSAKFWWGDDDAAASDRAWYKSNSDNRTHPVGLKLPNAFGLYDTVGNVWQWTEDCYDNTYAPAPTDGRANENPSTDVHARYSDGNCLRVDRGSWFAFPTWALRSATRERNPADYRDTVMGFRVAKTLP